MNLLLIVLILMTLLSLPTWPYSTAWGYYPSSGIGVLFVVLLLLALTRRRAL